MSNPEPYYWLPEWKRQQMLGDRIIDKWVDYEHMTVTLKKASGREITVPFFKSVSSRYYYYNDEKYYF